MKDLRQGFTLVELMIFFMENTFAMETGMSIIMQQGLFLPEQGVSLLLLKELLYLN